MDDNDGWVRGPALEIVLALRAVRVGDELLVKFENAPSPRKGIVRQLETDPQNGVSPYRVEIGGLLMWGFGLPRNIVGWRRPRGRSE